MPTGNFGDVFAGYVAMRMGLPIERLVIATNVNDILVRTLKTGTYEVRGVTATASPSMDIQVSSNFERLLFDAYGRDPRGARADGLARAVAPASPSRRSALDEIRSRFTAERADEDETAATIRTVQREAGYLIDPHTAVAVAVAEKEDARSARSRWWCCPPRIRRNFPPRSRPRCGITPALPDWLGDLDTRPERVTVLPADQGAVEKFINAASRAAREGAAA